MFTESITFVAMHEIKQISSLQNALVKKILLLQEKSRERKSALLFVLEGIKELQLAIKAGYSIETLLFYEGLMTLEGLQTLLGATAPKPELIAVTKEVYEKLAYRDSTGGIVAIGRCKTHDLESLVLNKRNPLILVAEAPEKPGNIGALLRTADAAGLDAVIIANGKTDLYNPNIIRSSVGCLFTNNIALGSTGDIISYLKRKEITIYCAALSASKNYVEVDFKKPSAIVVGTESTGLSNTWLEASDQNIVIPMQGEIDSMNVSVSAAILIFEAKRQRGFA